MIYVAIGGAIGSILRYLVSNFLNNTWKINFPMGTFIVNLLGCFLIGILIGLFEKQIIINNLYKFLLITGFCGGFTTFSTYGYECLQQIHSEQWLNFVLYIALSNGIGVLMVYLGMSLLR